MNFRLPFFFLHIYLFTLRLIFGALCPSTEPLFTNPLLYRPVTLDLSPSGKTALVYEQISTGFFYLPLLNVATQRETSSFTYTMGNLPGTPNVASCSNSWYMNRLQVFRAVRIILGDVTVGDRNARIKGDDYSFSELCYSDPNGYCNYEIGFGTTFSCGFSGQTTSPMRSYFNVDISGSNFTFAQPTFWNHWGGGYVSLGLSITEGFSNGDCGGTLSGINSNACADQRGSSCWPLLVETATIHVFQSPTPSPSTTSSATTSTSPSSSLSISATTSAHPTATTSSFFSSSASPSTSPSSSLSISATSSAFPTPTSSVPCTPGYYSFSGFEPCVPCGAGTFSSTKSARTCALCPAGRYGGTAGLSSPDCTGPCPGCPPGSANPPTTSSLSCASGGARALPSNLGMRLWPGAHPENIYRVDQIVAPEETCKIVLSLQSCSGRSSVVMDGVTRYVLGTAAELHMEAGEELVCGTLM